MTDENDTKLTINITIQDSLSENNTSDNVSINMEIDWNSFSEEREETYKLPVTITWRNRSIPPENEAKQTAIEEIKRKQTQALELISICARAARLYALSNQEAKTLAEYMLDRYKPQELTAEKFDKGRKSRFESCFSKAMEIAPPKSTHEWGEIIKRCEEDLCQVVNMDIEEKQIDEQQIDEQQIDEQQKEEVVDSCKAINPKSKDDPKPTSKEEKHALIQVKHNGHQIVSCPSLDERPVKGVKPYLVKDQLTSIMDDLQASIRDDLEKKQLLTETHNVTWNLLTSMPYHIKEKTVDAKNKQRKTLQGMINGIKKYNKDKKKPPIYLFPIPTNGFGVTLHNNGSQLQQDALREADTTFFHTIKDMPEIPYIEKQAVGSTAGKASIAEYANQLLEKETAQLYENKKLLQLSFTLLYCTKFDGKEHDDQLKYGPLIQAMQSVCDTNFHIAGCKSANDRASSHISMTHVLHDFADNKLSTEDSKKIREAIKSRDFDKLKEAVEETHAKNWYGCGQYAAIVRAGAGKLQAQSKEGSLKARTQSQNTNFALSSNYNQTVYNRNASKTQVKKGQEWVTSQIEENFSKEYPQAFKQFELKQKIQQKIKQHINRLERKIESLKKQKNSKKEILEAKITALQSALEGNTENFEGEQYKKHRLGYVFTLFKKTRTERLINKAKKAQGKSSESSSGLG